MAERRRDSRFEEATAEARASFVAAVNSGDAKIAASAYTDDARLLAPSAELIEGREAIEAFWRAGLDAGIFEIALEALVLEDESRLAFEIGRYALRLEPANGQAVVDRGKYLLVHRRQEDGSWRRAVETLNPDSPPTVRPRSSTTQTKEER